MGWVFLLGVLIARARDPESETSLVYIAIPNMALLTYKSVHHTISMKGDGMCHLKELPLRCRWCSQGRIHPLPW